MDEVFGGAGFVGGALVRALRAACRTAIVVDVRTPAGPPRSVPSHRINVSDRHEVASLARRLPEGAVFVNLAARQYQDAVPRANRQAWFDAVNYQGAIHVAGLAVETRAAGLVQFSSDMVYGPPERMPVTESHPLRPGGEYGRSRKAMEEALAEAADKADPALTILRPRLISGPGRLGVFVKLFELVRRGLPVPLIGSGRKSLPDGVGRGLRARRGACMGARVSGRGLQPGLGAGPDRQAVDARSGAPRGLPLPRRAHPGVVSRISSWDHPAI